VRLIAVLAVLLAGAEALAQPADDRASASMRVYADDDEVTVVSPSASADAALGERLAIEVSATADVISAASVDVITAASPGPVEDNRFDLGAGARYRIGGAAWLRARVAGAHENDFDGLRASLGGRVDLARRNTVVELDLTLGRDWIGHAVRDEVDEHRRVQRVTATVTQALDRRTLVDLTVDGSRVSGYQANPYRTVLVIDPASTAVMQVAEETPKLRLTGAALVRARRALGSGRFVHLDYRLYADDWGIVSHTASARGMSTLWPGVLVGLHLRGYAQGAADFHRRRYFVPAPALRTAERALGRMRTLYGGAVAEVALGDPLGDPPRLLVMAGLMRFWWLDHAPQGSRDALVMTVGVRAPIRR
jgi:hypothetical protein